MKYSINKDGSGDRVNGVVINTRDVFNFIFNACLVNYDEQTLIYLQRDLNVFRLYQTKRSLGEHVVQRYTEKEYNIESLSDLRSFLLFLIDNKECIYLDRSAKERKTNLFIDSNQIGEHFIPAIFEKFNIPESFVKRDILDEI
tara:strand:+ start:71995 stop:72423 length:429 start_codon:yes stop_codon:yes gene_type:complete